MSTIHNFQNSLSSSHSASDLPLWEACYRQFFTAFQAMVDHRQNGEHQRAGIDRSVILSNGKQILIDEKIRWKAYPDIALEEWSSENVSPGWVVKPLRCDYIAYAIAPIGKCYLLPTIQMQKAWRVYSVSWKAAYRQIRAQNEGYTTISWAIPFRTLFVALAVVSVAAFPPVQQSNMKGAQL